MLVWVVARAIHLTKLQIFSLTTATMQYAPLVQNRLIWLDLVRGLTALAVCMGHLRAALFQEYGSLLEPSLLNKLFYGATSLGHQAVMVFFVLSGFFVGGNVVRKRADFDMWNYFVARLVRLWVVLFPALALTFVLDAIANLIVPQMLNGAFESIWHSGPKAGVYSASLSTAIANTLFLQELFAPVYGSNSPLWSLANEFWYYVLFPCLALAIGWNNSKSNSLAVRAVYALVALAVLAVLPYDMLKLGAVWLFGVASFIVASKVQVKRRPVVLVAAMALFCFSVVYSKNVTWQSQAMVSADMAVGLGFAVLCTTIAAWPPPAQKNEKSPIFKLSTTLSDWSYSLYLTHFPVIVLTVSYLYGTARVAPNLVGIVTFVAWLAALVSIGAAFWYLFERHTVRVRKWLAHRRIP